MSYWIKTPRLIQIVFSKIIWKLQSNKKEIYLTFDDGPSSITLEILHVLEKENIKVTFFCIGDNVKRYPKLYDKIISAGHSVGNHSMTHLNGWKVDKKKYLFDVKKGSELINSNLFRPPYGKINIRSISKLKKKFNIIMWDINSGDFDRSISSKEVISNVVASTRNGSIVVLHDNENFKSLTLPSLLPIIKGLKEKGFSFRAIPYHPLR
jgi:peptidoglycan/xylan/chitin deacetylase (PgdA/CDA1 family)